MQAKAIKKDVLTIAECERNNETSLWVLNNTNPKGNVNVTVPDGMGQNTVLTIPVTFIPIDLTTMSTKQAILSSPNFRKVITSKMLSIISDEKAQELLSSDKAQAEMDRIYNYLTTEVPIELSENAQAVQVELAEGVSGFAMNLANTSDLDEEQVLTTLLGNESAMTEKDLDYIARTSVYPKVKTYAANKLVEMKK